MGNWGAIAESYDAYGPFSVNADGPSHGVRCLTRSGVDYLGPPPASTGLRGWVRVPADRLRYVMPVEDGPIEPENQTLMALADSLRKRSRDVADGRGELPPNDPDLVRFDQAVARLFEITQALAREGTWLGRVSPENILLIERLDTPDWEVVLTEWGFAYNPHVAIGDPPGWLTRSNWSVLWDRAPAVMNEWVLNGERPGEKGVDRRTLVRLLACLLVGRETVASWCAEAPRSKGGGSPLVSLPREAGLTSELWMKLSDALEGRLGLDGLADYLARKPPGAHFLDTIAARRDVVRHQQDRARRANRRRMLVAGVGVPLLGIALAGAYIIVDRSGYLKPPPPPPRLCPDCPGASPLASGLDELETARKKGRDQEINALGKLHALAAENGHKATSSELACLDLQRRRTLESLETDFARIRKTFEGLPEDSPKECLTLDTIQKQARAVLDLDPRPVTPGWLTALKEMRKWHCGTQGS